MNNGGDALARGEKSAQFQQPKLKDGKNTHGQTWEDIFGDWRWQEPVSEKRKES